LVDLRASPCDFQGGFGEGGVKVKSPQPLRLLASSAAPSHTMKSAKSGGNVVQVSLLVHEINNLICCIRMHASSLSVESDLRESVNEIIEASRQIETRVMTLASLSEILFLDLQSRDSADDQVGKG
jgi:hypothetical protein